ncbi:hypothetical protein [Pseudoduganella umbonata]|uniref:Uncharacterized protein n=1 Tax=Pseudoduganella umbonata TaxID=864828 RepID=A0A4P8HRB1_9BURK|nr:hypothetical protein [Pseudoduganella umbonata]MBB3222143.1 hypothetical protein [Pseudoduganella umbonata]QCP12379.1 hypothetical protein FCL38_19610 [Pseudoduganella umbonata]
MDKNSGKVFLGLMFCLSVLLRGLIYSMRFSVSKGRLPDGLAYMSNKPFKYLQAWWQAPRLSSAQPARLSWAL